MNQQRHFSFFSALPAEIRLMIWEYTWPVAQVIEAASCENFDDEYTDLTILRPVSSFDNFLRTDFGHRILEMKSPLEKCPPPLALWICCESCEHTLKRYQFIQHLETAAGSFYFNPTRDTLWFSWDLTSEPWRLIHLKTHYHRSLENFKTLLIQDSDWDDEGLPDKYCLRSFTILPGLEMIILLSDDYDYLSHQLYPCSAEEHEERAKFYREGFEKFLQSGGKCAARRLLYIGLY